MSQILTRPPLAPSKLLRWSFGHILWLAGTKPEREMSGLHGLAYHDQQLLIQLVQIHLLAKRLTEACQDLGRVILAAIKPSIHHLLHAPAQGLEQRGDDQGGDDQHHCVVRTEQAGQQVLPTEDEPEVDNQQARGEQAIDQRAINQHIDIVEAISQHGDACRDRNTDHGKIEERARAATGKCEYRDENHEEHEDAYCQAVGEPFQLLAFNASRPPETQENRDDTGDNGGEQE